MATDLPKFSTKEEEIRYWREKATEWEQKARALEDRVMDIETEFDDFRESSSTLEKELEKALEQSDQSFREMRTKCNRLMFDLDATRVRFKHSSNHNPDFKFSGQDNAVNERESGNP